MPKITHNEQYTIEQLIDIFSKHEEEARINHNENYSKYHESYGTDFPYEYFNICSAFVCFAKEIKNLKDSKRG